MRELISKEKFGNVIKKLLAILRVVTILVYIGINIFVLYLSIANLKYFSLFDGETGKVILTLFLFTLLAPGILILVLFIKKEHTILYMVKGVIQIVLFACAPYVMIIGLFIGFALPSYTNNYKNYRKCDLEAEELLEKQEFLMLPVQLPENISDVRYSYRYSVIFHDKYLALNTSWVYDNKEDFEKAKASMIAANSKGKIEGLSHEEKDFYSIGSSKEDKNFFLYGYNDDTQSVYYQINYEWVN